MKPLEDYKIRGLDHLLSEIEAKYDPAEVNAQEHLFIQYLANLQRRGYEVQDYLRKYFSITEKEQLVEYIYYTTENYLNKYLHRLFINEVVCMKKEDVV